MMRSFTVRRTASRSASNPPGFSAYIIRAVTSVPKSRWAL